MSILLFSVLLLAFSILAGLIGALTGLGGGIVIIPVLVLLFHINIHYAMGASLISVMATSSGTTAAFLRSGYTNLRIGLFLETTAVIGAFIGALLTAMMAKTALMFIFSFILFISAYLTIRRCEEQEHFNHSHPWALALHLNDSYRVQHAPLALTIMGFAGLIAGLLGIGSGMLKVLAMDQVMRLPYKVSTTTSNFMIGITAAVSAGIYFAHGYIDPAVSFPVMLGVLIGSFLGAKILPKISTYWLRILFAVAICIMGLQMLYKACMGTS